MLCVIHSIQHSGSAKNAKLGLTGMALILKVSGPKVWKVN